MTKRRVDSLVLERGLADDGAMAKALVMAGRVLVAERRVSKPGALVDDGAAVQVTAGERYVSRGGDKLEHALGAFGLDVAGLVAADIGSSTGGFTDCLLQHEAARVYAIDVGNGQLDYGLRKDPRVVVMEDVNARYLEGLPEVVDLVTVDVSFISLRLLLPVARGLFGGLKPGPRKIEGRGSILVLFKPQFEAEKREVPRGGVIRDPLLHATLIGRFAAWCTRNNFRILDMTASPILGSSGNREFFFWLRPI